MEVKGFITLALFHKIKDFMHNNSSCNHIDNIDMNNIQVKENLDNKINSKLIDKTNYNINITA